jgi:hypothetical protein
VPVETGSTPQYGVKPAARAAWRWWTRVAHRIGDFQARVLLSVFYYLILGPFALVLRRSDPLGIARGATPGWHPRGAATRPIAEQARRQS